ncbi:hypothetical protein [Acetobacter sp. UBA5411]|uniref:hypothetical protein n=1 Tax=Acetobacter sp. UBA5411 TaxID=1945905 RepID=UPI0025BCDB7B|nr:hypothetical protein [Acetobacter sp. UBA5411]
MMRLLIYFAMILLAGCAGNVSASRTHGPKPPPLRHATYDPGAAYGSAGVAWSAPVLNRNGTVQRIEDPRVTAGREDYEHAPWASGAAGDDESRPAGTF